MDQTVTPSDWDALSDSELDTWERKIASRYMGSLPWEIVVWGIGNTLIWLSLWPLVLMDVLPLWLAFPIAVINVSAAYLPSHDCQHSIIASRGRPLRWLNEFVGWFSLIPLAFPFRYMRETHMQHHAHANDPELDPDIDTKAASGWDFARKTIMGLQPAAQAEQTQYYEALQRTGKVHLMGEAIAFQSVFLVVLFACALSGYAIEAALLWWLPKHIALTYIRFYLSWMPHHPAQDTGRYRDTRGFRSRLGNLGSSGMQYHIIHHLYPRIPLCKTPAAYRALLPILERKGCELGW